MLSFSTLLLGIAALVVQSVAAGPVWPEAPNSGLVPHTWNGQDYECKCYAGDDCWPNQKDWDALNTQVGGNLHIHIPPEAACHNSFDGPLGTVETFDAAKCANVTSQWTNSWWTTDQQALLLWKYWSNITSCQITEDPAESCTLGYYGVYVIEAKTRDHITAGIRFADKHKLRLIIRNTGHDFAGRSTGWGSLVINTHSFQDIKIHKKWTGPGKYKSGAVTIAAGVQGRTILEALQKQSPPLIMVTGECATVGVAGGFISGGGHGPLTSVYGMAADNALQFEVITAKGHVVIANENENPDLFFALRGGGPSTFGVIASATFRTYKEVPAAGATLYINSTHTTDNDLIWKGISIFHKWSNHFVDHNLYVNYEILPFAFHALPFVAVGKTKADLDVILKPMYDELKEAGVPFDYMSKGYDGLWPLYIDLFQGETAGGNFLMGGWGFSYDDVKDNNDGIIDALRINQSPRPDLAFTGGTIGHIFNARHGPAMDNALNPRWRNTTNFVISALGVPVDASLELRADLQSVLTDRIDGALKVAGPGGYAYINEADPFLPNWSEHFWGSNYPKLKAIRQKWDPNFVFYAMATVGTEAWEVIEDNTRLCKRV